MKSPRLFSVSFAQRIVHDECGIRIGGGVPSGQIEDLHGDFHSEQRPVNGLIPHQAGNDVFTANEQGSQSHFEKKGNASNLMVGHEKQGIENRFDRISSPFCKTRSLQNGFRFVTIQHNSTNNVPKA